MRKSRELRQKLLNEATGDQLGQELIKVIDKETSYAVAIDTLKEVFERKVTALVVNKLDALPDLSKKKANSILTSDRTVYVVNTSFIESEGKYTVLLKMVKKGKGADKILGDKKIVEADTAAAQKIENVARRIVKKVKHELEEDE